MSNENDVCANCNVLQVDELNRLLFVAICQQDFNGVQDCIEKGADVNCKLEWPMECYNKMGLQFMTPLLLATNMYKEAAWGDSGKDINICYSIIKVLLENNADPNDFCYINSRPLDTVSFYICFFKSDSNQEIVNKFFKLLALFLKHNAIIYDSVFNNILNYILEHRETPESIIKKIETVQLVLVHGSHLPTPKQLKRLNTLYYQIFANWPVEMLLYCINYKSLLILL